MATLRDGGPYIYPTWLPKLLAGLVLQLHY